ncbi:Trans-2-enoyl-CoA reductase [Diplonema papillatum]|nr:Trans-2-enoyl-CoA reductase [Diplonema papillatum]
MTTRHIVTRGLRYAKNGPPSSVLKKEEWLQPFSKSGKDVVVRMLASPVHRHDKWLVEGQCGHLQTDLTEPKVGGTEGVGIVEDVGESTTYAKKGDYVVFNKQTIGTWADQVVTSEDNVDKVPSDLQPEDLAMMSVYGAAWRMVNDYVRVKPDDVVWVLGSGSVGTAAACLLQQKGAVVYVLMRGGRPNEFEMHGSFRRHLPTCATIKSTLLRQSVMTTITKDLPKPKLIINGVGGETLTESLRFAADGCKVVSYGNMSKQPLSVSPGRHLYNDVHLLSFWYGRYLASSTRAEREAMYAEIADMMRTGAHGNSFGSEWQMMSRLFVRAERYEFEKHHADALTNSSLLFTNRKPILRFGDALDWTHSGEWHKETQYFHPETSQYYKNISHPHKERISNEVESLKIGGPVLQEQFNELWDTEEAKQIRKNLKPVNMHKDYWEVMEDTYERYLETEGAKYNIEFNVLRSNRSPTDMKGMADCFFPDDDPHQSKTLEF